MPEKFELIYNNNESPVYPELLFDPVEDDYSADLAYSQLGESARTSVEQA